MITPKWDPNAPKPVLTRQEEFDGWFSTLVLAAVFATIFFIVKWACES